MWTDQILSVVLHDTSRVTSSILTGIYALNHSPTIVKSPGALLINLSPSYQRGTHWTSIVINRNKRGFYFDSLGRNPSKPIVQFLQRNCNIYYVNKVQYQAGHSVYCGLFCIIYIYIKYEM